MNRYKIAIDVMGSDNGPELLVKGALAALNEHEDLDIILFGDEKAIEGVLCESACDRSRIEVVNATEVVDNYDNPMEAIYKKTDSSLVKALMALSEREDISGLINASSTGALLAGSLRYVPAKQLRRPALASILPAEQGGFTCLVDTGANIDCTAQQLVDFAHMGAELMSKYYSIENPRIGLLSNGTEPTKGNKLVKETHALLKEEKDLNFVGNIEGNRALSGDCDVLVAEGFEGQTKIENVEELVSAAAEYENKQRETDSEISVAGFLEEISLITDIDKYDDTADAVVLMTIHAAKGLEFPTVFIAGCEEGIFPGQQNIGEPTEMNEERRLAYVAITRAKDKLYVTYAKERMMYGKTVYGNLSRFVRSEMPPSLIARERPERVPPRASDPYRTQRKPVQTPSLHEMRRSADISSMNRAPMQKRGVDSYGITRFPPGTAVRHAMFGRGVIVSAKDMGGDVLYEVNFDGVGTKKLMATYAKLERDK
jgi:fatty acid/phospholipid synthesis protein PlsX